MSVCYYFLNLLHDYKGRNDTIETGSDCEFFRRCDLYSTSSTECRYIKYAVCEMNIKISPDRKPNPNPNPIRNLSAFLIPNPM